jgi:leukotriene-A4 hydrolase
MKDCSSLSNPEEAKCEHFHLKLSVDFDLTIVTGSVEFAVVASKGAKNFVLDTRDLKISSVKVGGIETAYSLATNHEIFGSALSIPLPSAVTAAGGRCQIVVEYSTSPNSSACQWLPPAQTAGKRFPFLFTQCQAIHARSLLPCQDCPKAKCTWSSEILSPSWATVLMSALQEGGPGDLSTFRMFYICF